MRKALLVLLCLLAVVLALSAQDVDTYAYDQLTMREQMAYQAIQDCLTHLITSWNSGSFSQDTINKAYNCFLMDHPEIFWSDGFTYVTSYVNNSVSGHHVEFDYTMNRSHIQDRNRQIEAALIDIVLQLPSSDASYETVRAVYEWFLENCTYDELNLDQSMYSAMVSHSGVCASFSKAFQFIMQCLGIPCTVVFGNITQPIGDISSTLGHEWNLVCLDGNWYHVDVTSGISVTERTGKLDHGFLCCTTDEIERTHTINNTVPVPQCNSTDLNFYDHYGLRIGTYSRQAAFDAFRTSLELGVEPVAAFCSYRDFCDAVDDLVNNLGIFEILPLLSEESKTSISYSTDEQALLFWFHI